MARLRTLVCLSIALSLAVGLAPPASATEEVPPGNVWVGSGAGVDCVKVPYGVPGSAAADQPFAVQLVQYAQTGGVWSVRCAASGGLAAVGWGGVFREVSLKHDRDGDGVETLLASCTYDGVFQRSCEANYDFQSMPIFWASGLGVEPMVVRVCLGPWLFGLNVPSFDPLGVLGSTRALHGLKCGNVTVRPYVMGDALGETVGLLEIPA